MLWATIQGDRARMYVLSGVLVAWLGIWASDVVKRRMGAVAELRPSKGHRGRLLAKLPGGSRDLQVGRYQR